MRTTGSVTSDILPPVPRGAPVDGFGLAYDRVGSGPAVVALHGWPGSRRDYREVAAGRTESTPFLADARLHVLEGVGHFVPLQAPDEVAAAIRAATGTSA